MLEVQNHSQLHKKKKKLWVLGHLEARDIPKERKREMGRMEKKRRERERKK